MSTCECSSEKILKVSGKCLDLSNSSYYEGTEKQGYVPHISDISGGDYIRIKVCVDYKRLQNFQSLSDGDVIKALTE